MKFSHLQIFQTSITISDMEKVKPPIPKDFYEKVRSRLAKCRTDAGLTQSQVAKRLDVRQSYIANLESGQNEPSVWWLLSEISREYGVSSDYLLGINEGAQPKEQNGREVYADVKSPEARELIQEIVDILRQKDDSELPFYVNTLKLLLNGGKPPRIIGGE